MKSLIQRTAVAAALIGTSIGAMASGSIDTYTPWNKTASAGPFGEPDTATFGQSITMDSAGGVLNSFTFYLTALNLNIRSYVYEWDGMKTVGPALFTGAVFNIGEAFTGFKAVTIDTGAVTLQPNKHYVLLFTSSGLQAGTSNYDNWGALTSNAYSGGEFVFTNSGNDFGLLSDASGWDCPDGCDFRGTGADLAFKAQISPITATVPEASSYAMLMAGLALLGASKLRRRD